MKEEPRLSRSLLRRAVETGYRIHAQAVVFLPIGAEPDTWAFRVDTDSGPYFAKVTRGAVNEAPLEALRYLSERLLPAAVAPVRGVSGELRATITEEYSLVLYPFVRGHSAMTGSLSLAQQRSLGAALRALHDATPAVCAHLGGDALNSELFTMPSRWRRTFDRVQTLLADPADFGGPAVAGDVRNALLESYRRHEGEIATVLGAYQRLGRYLAEGPPRMVLCHGDMNRANIILTDGGAIRIVDWDGLGLAPPERDLRVCEDVPAILRGYGCYRPNAQIVSYYRYEWVVQELADFSYLILESPDSGEVTRREALREFERLFTPGDVVDHALGATAE